MLKFIYPETCLACESSSSSPICTSCLKKLHRIDLNNSCKSCHNTIDTATQICSTCLKTPPKWNSSASPFEFKGISRDLILRFKYSRHLYLLKYLCEEMENSFQEAGLPEPDIITYVPMHPLKKISRGWNQSELLAKEFAKSHPDSTCLPLLKRPHLGKAQASKAKRERLKSVKDLFSIKKRDNIKDRSILLIDDILTTGATLNACCKILRQEKPKEISVLTIARG
ncbi:phosphoribosyltransferase family protein [Lentisphaera marina]|uniref:ComF family protein n=1 Tax=Lentisphaera marina TaxID=1111041 RepID=UPI0023651084|nr:phosphoribosyltransferase family protein [Lentisphaera marina]MDD7984315.1 phosphoribosyltransferase family protein [Lentisphaera marina]